MVFRYFGPSAKTLHQLRQEMDRLVTGFLGHLPEGFRFGGRAEPAMNVWEEADALKVEAELPGVKADQIDVAVAGGELTLKVDRPVGEQADVTYHRRERAAIGATRTLRLPVEVNADRVQADLSNGVLTITLPKAEAAKPRRINVKTG
jgi:HSP20 family protein